MLYSVISIYMSLTNSVNTAKTSNWKNFMTKYNKYLKPAEVFKFDSTNYFLNVGLFLTSGWISIFIGFYISREVGLNVLKLCFKDLVLKIFFKTNAIVVCIPFE